MKDIVIIFGYNNTRLYDVERLRNLCKRSLNAEILLCKEKIAKQDSDLTPYTLQIDLEFKNKEIIERQMLEINRYLSKNFLNPVACLPFSDKGIPLGSHFAKQRGLVHDDCDLSFACIDKYTFRQLEAKAKTPEWYKKPFFKKIYSFGEAIKIITDKNFPLFFKPTTEGNSRGCIEIQSLDDLIKNKEILDNYFDQGVIVEECIKGFDEYSFDGVNGCYIITDKKTSNGYYRVETQHIIPAPLNPGHYSRLIEAGKIVAEISGSLNGAVHNELFLNKETGEVYCVEPNRRPGGLKIWDWIKIAFPGVDNWHSWVSWAANKKRNYIYPINNKYYVGCRMLKSPIDGMISTINREAKNLLEDNEHIIEIVFSKNEGHAVTSTLKDNSDFIGYFVCRAKTINDLNILLSKVEQEALKLVEIK